MIDFRKGKAMFGCESERTFLWKEERKVGSNMLGLPLIGHLILLKRNKPLCRFTHKGFSILESTVDFKRHGCQRLSGRRIGEMILQLKSCHRFNFLELFQE